MDLANLRLIIIDQADHAPAIGRIDYDLFFELAAHAFFVGACLGGVISRNMSADADATLGVQAAFALTFAASVLKEHGLSAGSAVAENHVRNKLLEARIQLHRRSRPVAGMGRIEQAFQVALRIAAEALKM